MRQVFLMLLLFSSFFRLYAQESSKDLFAGKSQKQIIQWQKSVGDEWFNQHVDAMIKVGQKVPDFKLGDMLNNYTGKQKLSDFRGKLVILDFWNTYCSSCIAAWPHLSKLQDEFGDQIQIILVNKEETKDKIVERLNEINKSSSGEFIINSKDVNNAFDEGIKIPANLPVITGKREDLDLIFPTRVVPHHVWIDEKGIARIIGDAENTNEEKIKEWIASKKVNFMNGHNSTPLYQSRFSYHQLMSRPVAAGKYNSIITSYNRYLSASGYSSAKNIIDKKTSSIRNTYINLELMQLYREVFGKYLYPQINNIIFGPCTINAACALDFTVMNVSDTLRYTIDYLRHKGYHTNVTDKAIMKSSVCYEQIASANSTEEVLKDKMLLDLNTYFGKVYGLEIEVYVEERNVPCYVLVRNSTLDKLSTTNTSPYRQIVNRDGKQVLVQRSRSLNFIIRQFIVKSSIVDLFHQQRNSQPTFFINETGFGNNNYVEIFLPTEISNMEELRKVLSEYDLDIIQAERAFNFLVFKEQGL